MTDTEQQGVPSGGEPQSLHNPDPWLYHQLKRCCQLIVSGSWLDPLSILVLMMSSVLEWVFNPCTGYKFIKEVLDDCILMYFVMEMVIKVVALGLFRHEQSYLRSHWHKLDAFVCFAQILGYLLACFGIQVKVCQAIGLLRLISRMPSMRFLVSNIADMLIVLANVFLVLIFIIHIFGLLGVQLWAGELHNRCFLGEDILTKHNVSLSPYYSLAAHGTRTEFVCSPKNHDGMLHCSDVPPYKEGGKVCLLPAPIPLQTSPPNWFHTVGAGANGSNCVNWNSFYNVCRPDGPDPNFGATSFDNIAYAWIVIFQVLTLQGWSEIMYYMMDTYSFWSFLFFIPLTVLGSFVIMNMCSVIISSQLSDIMVTNPSVNGVGSMFSVQLLNWRKKICNSLCAKVRPARKQIEETDLVIQPQSQRKLETLVKGKQFFRIFMVAVIVNTVTIAVDHHDQPSEMTDFLKICNIFFITLYVVEMMLKFLGLRWMYFQDGGNILEFFVVITSLWDISASNQSSMSFLHVSRVLRCLRFVLFFPYLRRQLNVFLNSVKKALQFIFLLFLFIFIFSILGMHLFGCTFNLQLHAVDKRKNFDSLLWSLVTVFQVLTEENWHLVFYNTTSSTSPWSAVYFVFVIFLGKHIILNLLMGCVIETFQAQGPLVPEDTDVESCCEAHSTQDDANEVNTPATWTRKVKQWCKDHEDWSLFLLSPQNRWRIFWKKVISYKVFDQAIVFCVLLSCVSITLERPTIELESMERWILDIADFTLTAVFVMEMLLKVTTQGLFLSKESYFRSPWNTLDAFLVFVSTINIFVKMLIHGDTHYLGILKILGLLRVLRPLRIIGRIPVVRLALRALFLSVKPSASIILLYCFFYFLYGVVGVQLFKGKFHHCVGQDLRDIVNKSDCLTANYHWVQRQYNFDNMLQALLSLFIMYSKNGWMELMYHGVDAVGVDQQPVKNHNEWMITFFISFMVVSIILSDLLIGVFVKTFRECQQKQREVQHVEEPVQEVAPDQGDAKYTRDGEEMSSILRQIRKLVKSKTLDNFFTVVIVISVLLMAVEHHNQQKYIDQLTDFLLYIFTILLIIEVVLKLVAFGVRVFIESRWNLLDIVVILMSVTSITLNDMELAHLIPFNPAIIRVCRMLRLVQVLKARSIRVVLCTLVKTLSQVGNICIALLFFLFIYAALGVELFGELECSSYNLCHGLHRHSNFHNFLYALLTLYRVCTGDNWGEILKDMLRECQPGGSGCSKYPFWALPIFFATCATVSQFVLANLVVGVIEQALRDTKKEREDEARQAVNTTSHVLSVSDSV